MSKRPTTPALPQSGYRYPSPNIPMSAIRRFARKLGERFYPEKIILFGSYAYGTPHEESDVDLLVHAGRAPLRKASASRLHKAMYLSVS